MFCVSNIFVEDIRSDRELSDSMIQERRRDGLAYVSQSVEQRECGFYA